jgi:UDP-galactose transporter B1
MIRQNIHATSRIAASTMVEEKEALLDAEDGNYEYQDEKTMRKVKENGTMQLLFCTGGIYGAYLLYGSLQEDIFTYSSPIHLGKSNKFTYIWFVQVVEALINATVSFVAFRLTEKNRSKKRKMKVFILSGFSQVTSKAFTSLSLSSGLSFPTATMAKSAKMAPVMMGQLMLGKSQYSLRDYIQVAMIIIGTATLGLSKNHHDSTLAHSSQLGVTYISLSLVMDGVTGGLQKRLKSDAEKSKPVKGFEFMTFTNMSMFFFAAFISICNGDLVNGFYFCCGDSHIRKLLCKFCLCSALGQSFIFHTIALFDPLICSTITTTRKIMSVFISIVYKGHIMNTQGWCGVALTCFGICCELHGRHQHKTQKVHMAKIGEDDSIQPSKSLVDPV